MELFEQINNRKLNEKRAEDLRRAMQKEGIVPPAVPLGKTKGARAAAKLATRGKKGTAGLRRAGTKGVEVAPPARGGRNLGTSDYLWRPEILPEPSTGATQLGDFGCGTSTPGRDIPAIAKDPDWVPGPVHNETSTETHRDNAYRMLCRLRYTPRPTPGQIEILHIGVPG
jgi:hypothetical protein